MRPEELITVLPIQRTSGAEHGYEWSCDLASEEQGLLEDFRVWVALEDAQRLPRPDSAADRWVEGQIEDFVHGRTFAEIEAVSPLRLTP